MKNYDGLFIFTPRETEEGRKRQLSLLETLIKKHEGVVTQKSEWGEKPIGYPIRKFKEGYFVHILFQMNPSQVAPFRNALELQENLLNFMLTVYDAKKQKPQPEKSRVPAARAAQ